MADIATAYVNLQVSSRDVAKGVRREFGQIEAAAKTTGDTSGRNMLSGMSAKTGLGGLGTVVAREFAGAARVVAAGSVGMAVAAGAGMLKLVDMAGRAEQSVGGVGAVFGKQATVIVAESKKAAGAFGLSAVAYQELATTMGATLKNKGVLDYTEKTRVLVGLGGDLAATYGGTAVQAVEALSSALRGETDPIERYGVSLNEAAVKAKLAEMGITGVATEAEKTRARLAIIMEQTATAQGQASREHDTYAASLERVKAQAQNAATEIGEKLLPTASKFLTDVVEPQIPRIAEWGRQFGTGASEFMDGMTRSSDDREKLGTDLTEWGTKGQEFRDKLDSIKTWWDTDGDQVTKDALALAAAVEKMAQFAGDFLANLRDADEFAKKWNPSTQGAEARKKLGWGADTPASGTDSGASGSGGGSWSGGGAASDEMTPPIILWWRKNATTDTSFSDWWAKLDRDALEGGNRLNASITTKWAEWETSHDEWLARMDGRWQGFWSGLFQSGTDGANGLGADAELHRGEFTVADDTWLIGLGERWGRFWTDRGTTQGERWASLRADIGTKWGEWEIGHDLWLTRQNERFNGWLTDTGVDLDTGWVTLRSNVGGKWAEWETSHDAWLARQNKTFNDWMTRMGQDGDRLAANMVDLMGKAWEKLPERFKQPVRDLVSWLNLNLIAGVNTLASKVGLGEKWLGDIPTPMADGGITNREPQIRNRPILWAEAGPEAYIPLDPGKRTRSLALWQQVGRQLGAYTLAGGAVFPLPAGSYVQTQGLHGVDGGYDYAAPAGTPVSANANATVVRAADLGNRSYGKYVQLSNRSLYAHLSSFAVAAGQQVVAGQLLGGVGSTGNSTGNHLHYVPGGSGILGAIMGALDIGQMFRDTLGDVAGKAQSALGGSPWGSLLASIPGKLASSALTTLKDKAASFVDAGLSGGSSQWAPIVLEALRRVGQPASMLGAVLRQIQEESGGNPAARNNWDINARNGDPSVGLLQVIGSTFAAYRDKSLPNDRTDPLANVTASLRYVLANYPSGLSIFDRVKGYAAGTPSAAPGWAVVGERGPELMKLKGGEQIWDNQTARMAAGGVQVNFSIDEGRMRGLIRTEVRQMAREGAL